VSAELEGGRVKVSVLDRGPGIDPTEVGRVFDRHYRVNQQGSTEFDGLGLGLAIASWVAELHGGSIVAENAGTGGCVMTLRLPAGRDRPPQPETA
jgi:two-component system sensor histidine kinase BaeS